jgi:hypothetical protein
MKTCVVLAITCPHCGRTTGVNPALPADTCRHCGKKVPAPGAAHLAGNAAIGT